MEIQKQYRCGAACNPDGLMGLCDSRIALTWQLILIPRRTYTRLYWICVNFDCVNISAHCFINAFEKTSPFLVLSMIRYHPAGRPWTLSWCPVWWTGISVPNALNICTLYWLGPFRWISINPVAGLGEISKDWVLGCSGIDEIQFIWLPSSDWRAPFCTDQCSHSPPIPVDQSLRSKECCPARSPLILYTFRACWSWSQVSGIPAWQSSGVKSSSAQLGCMK